MELGIIIKMEAEMVLKIDRQRDESAGFTLIELLVASVIALVAMAGMYAVFQAQQRTYLNQGESMRMQQTLRASLEMMVRELRMAGCNPTTQASTGITLARNNEVAFDMDINDDADSGAPDGDVDDGDAREVYAYRLNGTILQRTLDTSGWQVLAENIEALDFVYLGGDPLAVLNPGMGNVLAADLGKISAVEITLVARTVAPIPQYQGGGNFTNPQGTVIFTAPSDNFRRMRMSTRVRLRNRG